MKTKVFVKLMSRILAVYLMLLPISCIGIKAPSKGAIVAGTVSLLYLIVCYAADGRKEKNAD